MINKLLPSLILTISLLAFLNDSPLLMPMADNYLIVIFIIAFAIYTALFWKEKPVDEREELHVMFSGRISFIVGITILSIAVIKQSLNHNIDPWVIFALIAMVLAKSLSRIYSEFKK